MYVLVTKPWDNPKLAVWKWWLSTLNTARVMSVSIGIKQDNCANALVPPSNSHFHLQVRKSERKKQLKKTLPV